jgi:hypothetical protein
MAIRREYRFDEGTITLVEEAPFADIFIRLDGDESAPPIHLSANAAPGHTKIYSLTGNPSGSEAYDKGLRALAVDLYLQYLNELGLPPETEVSGTVQGGTIDEVRTQLGFWKRFGFRIQARPGLAPKISAPLGQLRVGEGSKQTEAAESHLLPLSALEPSAQ